MQINSPLPHPTAAEPKNADPVRTHARARTIIDAILEPIGGQVTSVLPMLGWTVYKSAGARYDDVVKVASQIRRSTGASQVTIYNEIYHVNIEVVHGQA